MKAYLPVLVAGTVSIGIGLRDKSWDAEESAAMIATFVLAAGVSLSDGTRVAPIVNALAVLFMIAVLIRATGKTGVGSNVRAKTTSKNARKK